MQTVEIHIAPRELPSQMAAMRTWLDEHRFEPSTFACDETPADIRVLVTFGAAGAAEAFASRFEGRLHVVNAPAFKQGPLSPGDRIG